MLVLCDGVVLMCCYVFALVLGGVGGHSTLYCVNLTTHVVEELLSLPSLLTGEEREGEKYGIDGHHMCVVSDDERSRVVVLGGRWNEEPNKFITECNEVIIQVFQE